MSTDPITGLREAVAIDETFRAELLAAASFEEAAALAGRRGWVVTAADIGVLVRELTPPERELSDAELDQVSGGRGNIAKTYSDSAKNTISNMR